MSTTMSTHLPSTKEIRDLFTGLLGKDVTLTTCGPLAPSASSPRTVAVYVDDHFGVRAIIACDLSFSAWAGAALALVPAPTAAAAIETNGLDDALAENLYEVLNVAASLFNGGGVTHSRLYKLYAPGEIVPADLAGLAAGRNRIDLTVDVAGYGKGALSIVVR
jgi:hypothetical protein